MILLVVTISSCSRPKEVGPTKIIEYIENLTSDDFSGVILLAKEDNIILNKAFGYANVEHKVKNTPATIFNLASITKMITAVGILKLYDSKKVSLLDPIGEYLPKYKNDKVRNEVTIQHLLTHTSGLNNFYTKKEFLDNDKSRYKQLKDFVSLFEKDTLLFEPGKDYHYSASGYVILGLIIENISGQNYYNYIKNEIFDPAQMLSTVAIEVDTAVENKADGYTSYFGDSLSLRKNDNYLSKASPAGFHYATAEDLFKFYYALKKEKLIKKETYQLMHTPKVKGYNTHVGYGVDIDFKNNQTVTGHSGGWYGIHNELLHFSKGNYTLVILSNQDDNGETGASRVKDSISKLIIENS